MKSKDEVIAQLLVALDLMMDGAEGYESEHGSTDRYWQDKALDRGHGAMAEAKNHVSPKLWEKLVRVQTKQFGE